MPAVDDFKTLNKFDQAVLGAGALAFIVSFFPFWGYSYHVAGIGGSASVSAWHSYGVLGVLLIIAATALAAVRVFAPTALPTLPVGINLLTFALSLLGAFFLVLRALTYHHGDGYGIKWGGYLLCILVIVQAVAAFLKFQSSGEKMPDFQAMQANKTAGAVPPPPGYGTTPPPPAATYPPSTPAGDFTLDDTNPPTH